MDGARRSWLAGAVRLGLDVVRGIVLEGVASFLSSSALDGLRLRDLLGVCTVTFDPDVCAVNLEGSLRYADA